MSTHGKTLSCPDSVTVSGSAFFFGNCCQPDELVVEAIGTSLAECKNRAN